MKIKLLGHVALSLNIIKWELCRGFSRYLDSPSASHSYLLTHALLHQTPRAKVSPIFSEEHYRNMHIVRYYGGFIDISRMLIAWIAFLCMVKGCESLRTYVRSIQPFVWECCRLFPRILYYVTLSFIFLSLIIFTGYWNGLFVYENWECISLNWYNRCYYPELLTFVEDLVFSIITSTN